MLYPVQRFYADQPEWNNWKKISKAQQTHIDTQNRIKRIRDKIFTLKKKNHSQTPNSLQISLISYKSRLVNQSPISQLHKKLKIPLLTMENLFREAKKPRKKPLKNSTPTVFKKNSTKTEAKDKDVFISLSVDLCDDENLFEIKEKKVFYKPDFKLRTSNLEEIRLIGRNKSIGSKVLNARKSIGMPKPWKNWENPNPALNLSIKGKKHTSVGISTDL